MEGWARFHRKIADWEWYTDPNTFRVFFHLVLFANHADKKWQGNDIKRGQIITSVESLEKSLKLSRQQIRTSINKLISTNEITTKPTNKFTLVTVVNYESYQKNEETPTNKSTNKSTIEQPTDNQQVTTNKNVKNVKNEKKSAFIPPTLEQVREYHKSESMTFDCEWFHKYFTTSEWINANGKPVLNWKLTMQTWQNRDSDKSKENKTKPTNRNRGIIPAEPLEFIEEEDWD